MLIPIILAFILLTITAYEANAGSIPTQFAFTTVTNIRGGRTDILKKFIDNYASMKCDIASELIIIWNSPIDPKTTIIFEHSSTWVRPVYFFRSQFNSMDWRYKIPKQSKANVFFSMDDDISITCEQLTNGFKLWQQHAIGALAPIVSFAGRFFEYTNKQGFHYGQQRNEELFNHGLVGIAFLSRHLMELYYTDLKPIQQMRKMVIQVNNCDDIGLNFVSQYYYPQLMTVVMQSDILERTPYEVGKLGGQSTRSDHFIKRDRCIKQFTKIFSSMTLRYRPYQSNQKLHSKDLFPLTEKIVTARYLYLQNIIDRQELQGLSFERIDELLYQEKHMPEQVIRDLQLLNKKLEKSNEQKLDSIIQVQYSLFILKGWLAFFCLATVSLALKIILSYSFAKTAINRSIYTEVDQRLSKLEL